jgi:DNA topoisomerase IB
LAGAGSADDFAAGGFTSEAFTTADTWICTTGEYTVVTTSRPATLAFA